MFGAILQTKDTSVTSSRTCDAEAFEISVILENEGALECEGVSGRFWSPRIKCGVEDGG